MIRYSISGFAARYATCALAFTLAACGGGQPANPSLYSVKQPVVERSTYTIDLVGTYDGLAASELRRLNEWFDGLALGYGDQVAIDDAFISEQVRADVAAIAARRGVLLANTPVASLDMLAPSPGTVRIVVSRTRASVPGCPDWSAKTATDYANATSPNFGCAINGNFAAMLADPEHLLEGASGSSDTLVMSASKAIDTYRQQEPTGAAGLSDVSSQGTGE